MAGDVTLLVVEPCPEVASAKVELRHLVDEPGDWERTLAGEGRKTTSFPVRGTGTMTEAATATATATARRQAR